MKHKTALIVSFITVTVVTVLSNNLCAGTGANNGDFSFQLESDGYPLSFYYSNGRTYVEGVKGEKYAIRIFNNSAGRVEAVVTVDGRDVISGKEGDYSSERGYIIAPHSSVLIEGFRTSLNGVAEFYFTDVNDSYAARMKNAVNTGVIGVAIFKEKRRRRGRHRPSPLMQYNRYSKRKAAQYRVQRNSESIKGPQKKGRAKVSERVRGSSLPLQSSYRSFERGDYEEQQIGTGYGEYRYSPAKESRFRRRSRRPSAKLAIYYDDFDGLVSRGVIHPSGFYRPDVPNPFPLSDERAFAPPPPSMPCWRSDD
jgi:hypothetical protein